MYEYQNIYYILYTKRIKNNTMMINIIKFIRLIICYVFLLTK